jgi:hypothetical protein
MEHGDVLTQPKRLGCAHEWAKGNGDRGGGVTTLHAPGWAGAAACRRDQAGSAAEGASRAVRATGARFARAVLPNRTLHCRGVGRPSGAKVPGSARARAVGGHGACAVAEPPRAARTAARGGGEAVGGPEAPRGTGAARPRTAGTELPSNAQLLSTRGGAQGARIARDAVAAAGGHNKARGGTELSGRAL